MVLTRSGSQNESTEVLMKARLLILGFVLLAFGVFSTFVVVNHGYTGFIELALSSQWGMQVFLDLVIALVLFSSWMIPDAKRRGISPWPYFVGILALGSIGALAYLVHRTLREVPSASLRGAPPRTHAPR